MVKSAKERQKQWIRGVLAMSGLAAVLPGCSGEAITTEPPVQNLAVHNAAEASPLLDGSNAAGSTDSFGMLVSQPMPQANVFGELPNVRTDPRAGASEFGFQQHTFVDEGYDSEPAVSPDGKFLVYSSTRHSETTDIYMQRVDGLAVTQLTSDGADDAFPTFSPDGQHIAFASNRGGSWDIYMMDRTGKNIVQVTSGPSQDMHPSFSPDGTRIAYCSLNGRGQWELWIVNLVTSERRQIGYGLFPRWSPAKDRDVLAFQRARNRGGRWFSIWTCEIADGEARSITEVAESSNAAIISPGWSPDGRQLTYATILEPNAADAHGKPTGQQDIWTINADGTGRHRLTDGKGVNTGPFWASDGRIYFVSNRGGAESIWSVSSGNVKPLSTASVPKD